MIAQTFSTQLFYEGKPLTRPVDIFMHNLDQQNSMWQYELPTENIVWPLRMRIQHRGINAGWFHFNVEIGQLDGYWLTPQLPAMVYLDRWSIPSLVALTSQSEKMPGYFALIMQGKAELSDEERNQISQSV